MSPIKMSERERKKPLSFDPSTKRLLYLADIQSGKGFPPHQLDEESKRELVLKRLEMEDPFSIESLGALNKDQQMEEVRRGTEMGKQIIQAELTYVEETIAEIQKDEIV